MVVLLPHNQTSAIPQILEDMREMLCRYDIQSRTIRKYFQRYLHQRTDHFIHEFYNFAISAYDIVGYDRHVDYSARNQSTSTTVEISDGSEDDEVQVIEPIVTVDTNHLGNSPPIPLPTTTVVMETSGAQQENCFITDVTPQLNQILQNHQNENQNVETNEEINERSPDLVLGSSSSDSECEFVLALKPPHLRTPEMLSLDSASDSDVIFIPNPPELIARVDSSTTDSEDNKPLAITKLKLKSEVDESKSIIHEKKIDIRSLLEPEIQIDAFNYGASTSHQSMMDQQLTSDPFPKVKKIYFAPKRKRISTKNVFEKSSSESSSSSGSTSDSSSNSDANSDNHRSKKKRRKVAEKNMKLKRISSAKNQKPLSLLPSTEEALNGDEPPPRVKSVIIKMKSNQPYVMQKSSNTESSSSES
jgi:E3 ubiquitin-protein ligase Topors